jgi:phosphatidylserine/phosphatidylglycerophosphate/cardiolipin synthase-like enzyme
VLRDLLEERVDAVPAGGTIDWVVYYFRDEQLAEALIRAHRRGVAVRVCIDGDPLQAGANDKVIQMLSGPDALGDGLRVVRQRVPGHLHTKLYCFSHPHPVALVGSFNPSGNDPEDFDLIAKIGDQDRGHNMLVEIDEPALVKAFVRRIAAIHSGKRPFGKLMLRAGRRVLAGAYEALFFPRWGSNPLDRRLSKLGPCAKIRVAASHFDDRRIARRLARIARRGGTVEVVTHHTKRRSPERLVRFLRKRGVETYRYEHPDDLPMHAKFIVAEDEATRWTAFGSYNLNPTSRWLNQELLVLSEEPELWRLLRRRWEAIKSEPWCRA